MRELLEQGVGIAIIGGVAAVGVLARMLLLGYYGRLSRACTRFEETKNKTIAYIREDLRRREEREQEIKNISVYTEYRLAEGRICGVRVNSLEHAVLYSLLLIGTSSVLVALAGVLTDCGYRTVLEFLFVGGASVTGLLVLDSITGLREKNKRVRLRIRNYIENSFCTEANGTERMEEEKAKRHRKKAEKQERKKNRSGDKPKAAEKKKHGKAQEEKRRLTEELLRERRQLEARSFAEQRKKEREEAIAEQAETVVMEDIAEQVQAEAAVTECPTELSYEALLNEFLKEYPA